jgi:cysteinyl-tRNA synthetase
MSLRLYNTRTHAVAPLVPLVPGEVKIYVCGLTPSAEAHLGHARSFLFFDVLRRYLAHPRNGFHVTYVQNVTDIDDRSIAEAEREGTSVEAVVGRYYGRFKAGMRTLGVREPDLEPHATQHIDAIVDMIAELIAIDHAYATEDGVYYAVKSFPRYGELSHRDVDELLVGARIAENEHKRDPLDFALWKFAKPGEPAWPSPWGTGRPGWHIECSAMSRELLGVPFDIHGGGTDLIFPHHENEIAQSEPLMPPHVHMANTWVHGAMLNFDGKKMSKSLGNFEPLTALLARHDPVAIRLLFLQTGYRKPMNFTEDSIAAASSGAEKLRRAYDALASVSAADRDATADEALVAFVKATSARFFDALDDDMNTAGALGTLFDVAATVPKIAAAGASAAANAARALFEDALGVLGVGELLSREAVAVAAAAVDPAKIERLRTTLADAIAFNGEGSADIIALVIDARNAARKARDFALGDRLRNALSAEGIVLTDGKDGSTTWTVAGA